MARKWYLYGSVPPKGAVRTLSDEEWSPIYYLAESEAVLDQVENAQAFGPQATLADLVNADMVAKVRRGTKVEVLGYGEAYGRVKLRVVAGAQKGVTGWGEMDWLR